MFRNEKLVVPSRLHISLTTAVAICSFGANYFFQAYGLILAIIAMVMIASQFWFSFCIWPTFGHRGSPFLFGLYWGLMIGLVVPFLLSVMFNEGMQGVLDLFNG